MEHNNPTQAGLIRKLPWVADGVATEEKEAVEALIDLAHNDTQLFRGIVVNPFMYTFDQNESTVVQVFANLHESDLNEALILPEVRDGITDNEAAEIAESGNLVKFGLLTNLFEMQEYMLGLVNKAREEAGLSSVILGDNGAAEQHAEEKLAHNYSSHWGLDGYTPYMRYTLAGGSNYEAENGSGPAFLRPGVKYSTNSLRNLLDKAHAGLMQSSGHRENILNKWHKKVNLGIACNQYTCSVVQQFEGNYIEFTKEPTISHHILSFAGELTGGFTFKSVQVWYDQPPHPLTLGQLDATYSYLAGQEPATFLLKPAPPGYSWSAADLLPTFYTWHSGVDPYSVDPNRSRDASPFRFVPSLLPRTKNVPWTVASTWQISGASFEIKANIGKVIGELGPGVYTVLIWGINGGEEVPLTNYSIFVE